MKKHLFLIAALALLVVGCKPDPNDVKLKQNQMLVNGVVYDFDPMGHISPNGYFIDGCDVNETNGCHSIFIFDIAHSNVNQTIDLTSLTNSVYGGGVRVEGAEIGWNNDYINRVINGYINDEVFENQSIFKSGSFTTSTEGGFSLTLEGVMLNDEVVKVNFFIAQSEIVSVY